MKKRYKNEIIIIIANTEGEGANQETKAERKRTDHFIFIPQTSPYTLIASTSAISLLSRQDSSVLAGPSQPDP